MPRRIADTTELGGGSAWRLEVVGALVLVACDPPAWRPPAADELDHPYAPAAVGDEWEYEVSQHHPSLKMPSAAWIDRILRAERAHGRLIARVRSELPGNPAATHERDLVITPEGVSADIGTMTTGSGDVQVREAKGTYLPRSLAPGLTWQWSQEIDTPLSTMSVSATCEALSEALVRGPSGVYSAVHVRCVTRNLMKTLPVKGSPVEIPPIDHTQTEDNYYARGVGLVRSLTTTPAGYLSERLLVRYRPAAARGPR